MSNGEDPPAVIARLLSKGIVMDTARYHKVKIGEHELNAETLMLGYGYDPSLSEGSVKPPVFLTSTFVFQTAEQGRDFFDYLAGRRAPPVDEQAGLVYSRFNHPNRRGSARDPREG
jgi:methionine-gamma-lyase